MALATRTDGGSRKPARQPASSFATAALSLLLVATLLPALMSITPAGASNPQASCRPPSQVNIFIELDPGTPGLKLVSKQLGPRTAEIHALPADPGRRYGTIRYESKSCILPDDTEVSFVYALSGTSLAVFGYTKVPVIGTRQISCEIRQNGVRFDYSPYFCKADLDQSNFGSPLASFTIGTRPKETVTDPERQGALATQFASSCEAGTPSCSYKPTSRTFLRMENKQISDWYNNCSDTDKYSPEETWEVTSTIENSFNFKVSAETGKVLELFTKTAAEVQYNTKWSKQEKYTFKLALPVPAKKMTAWFYAAGYDKIVGDFTFTDNFGGPIYVLPNATVLLPNTQGVRSNPTRPYDPSLCLEGPSELGRLPLRPMFAQ